MLAAVPRTAAFDARGTVQSIAVCSVHRRVAGGLMTGLAYPRGAARPFRPGTHWSVGHS